MNLNFSDSGNNKCTGRSLQDGIEIVSAGLDGLKKATDRIMAKSDDPAFQEAHNSLDTISENVETSALVLTSTRIQTFSR